MGYQKINDIISEIENVVVGKHEVVRMVLVAMLAGGHVLVEDVPGVGKTTLAMALGRATGLVSKRAQFTPDVMASDITGFTMLNKESNKFEYRAGLVFCNILLADEINRASPKTQSALLEAMEEQRVTVDGVAHTLPNPFMVIATQNNLGYIGTFPLPEAQLDRFILKISIGYPTQEQEMKIISDRQIKNPLDDIKAILTKDEILACMEYVKEINVKDSLHKLIVQLVSATRTHPAVSLGASPRASLSLMRASQAYAFTEGREYVKPEDIISVLPYVISHRVILTQEAKIKKVGMYSVLRDIVNSVAIPFKGE